MRRAFLLSRRQPAHPILTIALYRALPADGAGSLINPHFSHLRLDAIAELGSIPSIKRPHTLQQAVVSSLCFRIELAQLYLHIVTFVDVLKLRQICQRNGFRGMARQAGFIRISGVFLQRHRASCPEQGAN